jgi:hypothetical protein
MILLSGSALHCTKTDAKLAPGSCCPFASNTKFLLARLNHFMILIGSLKEMKSPHFMRCFVQEPKRKPFGSLVR